MKEFKVLAIDFDPIEHAMRDIPRESNDYYLDRSTARVIALSRSLLRFLSDDSQDRNILLPAWESAMIPLAREIVIDASQRFVRVPEAFGCPEHQMIKDFILTLRSSNLKNELKAATKGRWSCHRFKDIMKADPSEQNRWKIFRKDAWKERIQRWLETHGILAVNGKPTPSGAETR